jgi:hypothetical protein
MGGSRADARMRVVPAADPLADLARLRRPTGPWLHLLDGAPSDARQLGWMLGQDGVVVRILRGHCVRTGYGLFDEAAAALQLPGDPVEDWAALTGLLTDMSWLPGAGHLLVVSRAALLLAAAPLSELDGFVTTVREVARGRAEEGDPVPFHVVLQDDAVGLAGLRTRLDVVGARYDHLAGWDAEEPVAETVVSSRSGYESGDPRPDELDRAVADRLSTWDGVLAVRRSWEVFRGPDGARVRVYAPVLADPLAAPEVVAAVVAAAAALGAGCLAVPLPADERGWDPRQQALAAASAVVWPEPELPPEPATTPAPASAVAPPAGAPSAGQPAAHPEVADPGPAEPATASTVDSRTAHADPGEPETAGPAESADLPADDPGGAFELVAANLEWRFASGAVALDPVDAALVRYAGGSQRLVGLFRTWVADPAGGWVRVVMAYVGSGSISGVETERSTIVDIAQRSGARRCCIEIVGLSDVGDVHRWLEERSVALWRGNPGGRRPRAGVPAAPAADATPADETPADATPADATAAAPTGPGAAPEVDDPAVHPAAPPQVPPAQAAPSASAADAPPATPAQAAPPVPPPVPSPAQDGPAGAGLPSDAVFEPGPGEEDETLAGLVGWAAEQPGVLGVITAWTEVGGRRTVVVGIVIDGEVDQQALHAEVTGLLAALPMPHLVESFAPSRGLPPLHLRLYRGSTRVWTRKVERVPTTQPGVLQLDTTYHQVDRKIDQVLEVSTIDDEELGGFTLVGLDLNASVQRGAETPDDRDGAVSAWVRDQPHALAALRAVVSPPEGTEFPVYSVLVTADADRPAIRRGVAQVVAGTGADRCGVEVFCPFDRIAVFHVQLYGVSLSLWKSDRPPPSTKDDPPAGPDASAATEASGDPAGGPV